MEETQPYSICFDHLRSRVTHIVINSALPKHIQSTQTARRNPNSFPQIFKSSILTYLHSPEAIILKSQEGVWQSQSNTLIEVHKNCLVSYIFTYYDG